jgi:hypothetical protein
MFIVATLVWAAIIFVLVIYSPLFRKFFLKWFANNDNQYQTKGMNQLLLEQKEIKESLLTFKKELEEKEKNQQLMTFQLEQVNITSYKSASYR